MRQRVNLKTRHPRVWESSFFVLRPQSGSEHELTDPLTSLRCLAPVLKYMFCVETKHVLLSAAGSFSFLPRLRRKCCRAVQADSLLVFPCWFPDLFCDSCNIVGVFEGSLTRQCSCCSFVTQWSCGVGEFVSGVHTLVAGVVQVYHRLQVVEEEEQVRKVEQEVEREDQGEETTRMTMHMEMT